MTPQELRNSILQLAIQGKLVEQRPEEGTGNELYKQIQAEKQALVKAGKIKKEKLLPEITEDEKPFEIPENWIWVRLGTILRVIGGISYDKKDVTTSGYRILRGGNIQQMKVLLEDNDVFLPEQYRDEDKLIREGDILIVASTGSKAVIGKAGYVDRPIADTMIGAFLRICRPFQFSTVNYLRCVFDSDFYRKHIRELSQGTNINNVKESYITGLAIPLPPLDEQKRIVAKLEELLPYIDRYEVAWTRLGELDKRFPGDLQKSVLQLAIQGKLVEQRPNEDFEYLIQEISFENDEPFEIPETWKWSTLGLCCEMYTGNSIPEAVKKTKYTDLKTGYDYIGTKDVSFEHAISYNNGIRIPKEDNFKIAYQGSVLLCIEGGSAGRKIGILDRDVCFGNKLCMFNPKTILNKYVFYYLQSYEFRRIFTDRMTGIIGGVSMKKLKDSPIPLPPLSEQKRIVAKIEELLPLCERLTQINAQS